MFGILSKDRIEVMGHSLFSNFRLALYNYFEKSNFKDVDSVADLNDITHLFIIDEHFQPHTTVWQQPEFQKNINNKNIRVIVFNFERIFNSAFPWNVDHQKKLENFQNYYQFVSDVDDAKLLKKDVINKQFLSKDTKFDIMPKQDKLNKILFIGQLEGQQYLNRRNVIKEFLQQNISIDTINTNRNLTYTNFINKINDYQYILNPLGTGKFVNLRHFEALYCNTIPIQQMTPDMINWNMDIKNCIIFSDLNNIADKIINHIPLSDKFYLEDYFNVINLKNYL